jgi:hypothetical protein
VLFGTPLLSSFATRAVLGAAQHSQPLLVRGALRASTEGIAWALGDRKKPSKDELPMNTPTPLRGPARLLALLGVAVGLAGCQGAGAFAQVSEKLDQVTASQQQILSRLDALDAKIDEAAKRPAGPAAPGKQAGPQPGQPDPAATYKVAVSPTDSSKGPADAKITLVEWSDFQ